MPFGVIVGLHRLRQDVLRRRFRLWRHDLDPLGGNVHRLPERALLVAVILRTKFVLYILLEPLEWQQYRHPTILLFEGLTRVFEALIPKTPTSHDLLGLDPAIAQDS